MEPWVFSLRGVVAATAILILMSTRDVAGSGSDDDVAGKARGHLYSAAAVNQICSVAQGIVASTFLVSNNTVFGNWSDFLLSNAAPDSIVDGCWPTWVPPENPDLPLETTQHVVYGTYGSGDDYPQVVSCKMKNAGYLDMSGLDEEAEVKTCRDVHVHYVDEVISSLTLPERENLQYIIDEDEEGYVFEDDEEDFFFWTTGFPEDPYKVLYRQAADGPIHIKSKKLFSPSCPENVTLEPILNFTLFELCAMYPSFPFPFPESLCEPRKWGTHYCHLAAPEYIREAFTGGVEVPIII